MRYAESSLWGRGEEGVGDRVFVGICYLCLKERQRNHKNFLQELYVCSLAVVFFLDGNK